MVDSRQWYKVTLGLQAQSLWPEPHMNRFVTK